MGKARHPHNSKRPPPKKITRAIEAKDNEALRIALTPRQKAFAREYVADFNATAAAIRAGYSVGYANRQGYILVKHKGVAAYIDYLTESKVSKLMSISPEWVLQQITSIITKEGTKDGDKLRGLEALARHLGMFIDRTEITGKDGDAIAIQNQRIEEDASDFTSRLSALRDRAKKDLDREKETLN